MWDNLPQVYLSGQLHWVGPCCHRQCHYALGVDPVSTEADEWRVKRAQPFWIQSQLLEGWEVDDVRRATIIDEDPLGIEPFYI